MMKREAILKRVEKTLEVYKDDADGKYYKELKKSYKEFNNMGSYNKNVDDLYLSHMDGLCDYIEDKKHSFGISLMIVITMLFTIGLTISFSVKYKEIGKNLDQTIIKANKRVSLSVSYENLQNFTAYQLDNEESFMDLNYMTINIASSSTSTKKEEIEYNVYLVPVEYDSKDIPLEAFRLNVNGNKDIIKISKKDMDKDGRIKIYTGHMSSSDQAMINLRMWIDKNSNLDYYNKNFNFKLYVDGYNA